MPPKASRSARANSPDNVSNADLIEVIVSFDLGSTSGRMFVESLDPNRGWSNIVPFSVQTLNKPNDINGDFPAQGYYTTPHGSTYEPDYPRNDAVPVPIKYSCYGRVKASYDLFFEELPHAREIILQGDDPAFQARCEDALDSLFRTLHARLVEFCTEEGLVVKYVALSIPVQWTMEFEELYTKSVAKAFGWTPEEAFDRTFFVSESEALANCIFEEMNTKGLLAKHDSVQLFDFGGHNMNVSTYQIVHDVVNGDPVIKGFVKKANSDGSGGGSERWKFEVGELLDLKLAERGMVGEQKRTVHSVLMDHFKHLRSRYGPDLSKPEPKSCFESIVNTVFRTHGDHYLKLANIITDYELILLWEKAHKLPLQKAREQLGMYSQLNEVTDTENSKAVLLCGGTALHEGFKHRFKQACGDAGLKLTYHIRVDVSRKISKGAALAIKNTLTTTTERFMMHNLAFGIQMKQGQGNEPGQAWDDLSEIIMRTYPRDAAQPGEDAQDAPTLFAYESRKVVLHLKKSDEIQLVLNPHYKQDSALTDGQQATMAFFETYDFLPLGSRYASTWTFKLECRGSRNDVKLLLFEKSSRMKDWKTREIPVFYDGGARCIHAGHRGKTYEESGLDFGARRPPVAKSVSQRQGTRQGLRSSRATALDVRAAPAAQQEIIQQDPASAADVSPSATDASPSATDADEDVNMGDAGHDNNSNVDLNSNVDHNSNVDLDAVDNEGDVVMDEGPPPPSPTADLPATQPSSSAAVTLPTIRIRSPTPRARPAVPRVDWSVPGGRGGKHEAGLDSLVRDATEADLKRRRRFTNKPSMRGAIQAAYGEDFLMMSGAATAPDWDSMTPAIPATTGEQEQEQEQEQDQHGQASVQRGDVDMPLADAEDGVGDSTPSPTRETRSKRAKYPVTASRFVVIDISSDEESSYSTSDEEEEPDSPVQDRRASRALTQDEEMADDDGSFEGDIDEDDDDDAMDESL